MCGVNILKDELHDLMGKNMIVGIRKPQFHLCNVVTSYPRPVFPQRLSDRADLDELFQTYQSIAVPRELLGNIDSWIPTLGLWIWGQQSVACKPINQIWPNAYFCTSYKLEGYLHFLMVEKKLKEDHYMIHKAYKVYCLTLYRRSLLTPAIEYSLWEWNLRILKAS